MTKKKKIISAVVLVAVLVLGFLGYKAYIFMAPSAQVDTPEEVEAEVVETPYEKAKREKKERAAAAAAAQAQAVADSLAAGR